MSHNAVFTLSRNPMAMVLLGQVLGLQEETDIRAYQVADKEEGEDVADYVVLFGVEPVEDE